MVQSLEPNPHILVSGLIPSRQTWPSVLKGWGWGGFKKLIKKSQNASEKATPDLEKTRRKGVRAVGREHKHIFASLVVAVVFQSGIEGSARLPGNSQDVPDHGRREVSERSKNTQRVSHAQLTDVFRGGWDA